uniref:F5/8 type C domain-containing protein n=1 Tax=Mesocestoides corti TaxID=53468 RepID=A0A5K3G6T5_MESCO
MRDGVGVVMECQLFPTQRHDSLKHPHCQWAVECSSDSDGWTHNFLPNCSSHVRGVTVRVKAAECVSASSCTFLLTAFKAPSPTSNWDILSREPGNSRGFLLPPHNHQLLANMISGDSLFPSLRIL